MTIDSSVPKPEVVAADTTVTSDTTTPSKSDSTHLLVEPVDGIPPVWHTPAEITQCAAALASGTGPVAIDAERASGFRYGNRAYLVQLRREGSGTHLIDPIDVTNLAAINDVLRDVEWIFHAASQDLECLAEIEMTPTRLFDTEVAARILGKPRVGLAAIAQSELGISLRKAHSAADWSTRPLPEDWLRYAALDVELLADLRALLGEELRHKGRLDWALEEFEYVRRLPPKTPRVDPWRRTSGIHRVRSAQGLAVVAATWYARNELAARRDIAPGRVLPDRAIVAAALALPKSRAALGALPEFSGRGTRRRLAYWWDAVGAGLATPSDQLPIQTPAPAGPPPPRIWPDRCPAAAARLAAARGGLARLHESLGIPVENLLMPDTVRRLCWDPPEPADRDAIDTFLARQGARRWQIALSGEILTEAMKSEAGKPDVA